MADISGVVGNFSTFSCTNDACKFDDNYAIVALQSTSSAAKVYQLNYTCSTDSSSHSLLMAFRETTNVTIDDDKFCPLLVSEKNKYFEIMDGVDTCLEKNYVQ